MHNKSTLTTILGAEQPTILGAEQTIPNLF
jgi:hypothetical protein